MDYKERPQQNQMLIRHISIPRNSNLSSLQEPKQQQDIEEQRDYSTFLTRTLNPESPDQDVLISTKQRNKQLLKDTADTLNKITKIDSQFLKYQEPQTIEEFTNINLSPKKQTYNGNFGKSIKRQTKSEFRVKQKLPTFSTMTPQLNNQAYFNQNQTNRISYFSPIINNPYFTRGDDQNEQENAIVNQHSKTGTKDYALLKTIDRFRNKRLMNESREEQRLNSQKKYNFSMPKHDFGYKDEQNKAQFNNIQKQFPLQKRQKSKMSSEKYPQKNYVSTGVIQDKKRKALPIDESDHQIIDGTNFGDKNEKYKIPRKASEQESTIKPKSQSKIQSSKSRTQKINSGWSLANKSNPQKFQISYRVPLCQLKQICSMKQIEKCNIIMKIPEIFSYPLFSGNQDQEELFKKADQLLKHLQVRSRGDVGIKKYTNCVLITSNNIGIVWHYSGKVYFGGWKYQMLDEGCRQGLGLEWVPKKHVYYGQFVNNKREGTGIMKNSNSQILIGLWHQNKYVRPLTIGGEIGNQCTFLEEGGNWGI